MTRRQVEANVWYAMFERWHDAADGWEPLPIMWPRLAPWWPWHPAVVAALALGALVVVLFH